ncbi:protein-L-isoaspartate(D-aspartate) O-methyltransferase [Ponticaulis sp.]|uniref:protein-L-isoaspartate(D-aspartate) O-methyltransferase n=1 Tax=Ponticaulis sp. TaxID=2020902 RepID=UPI000B6E9CE8|nr:protein-L-isoaspartate(D-aspartate) O-methyltransferase [Ponticaulis sp.]MAI92099.1 protein-L-isoaspartate(D-aspartate) O-methyltransferase [Ponticaulis sp.]OUX96273.1 MAG: protein-L-isoaspartate O-methyltransferase [Hyphomonadaceae bacterium TMED5]
MSGSEPEEDPFRKMRLILELRQSGLTDNFLLNSVEALPRELFVSPDFAEYAYDDFALPIACGQSMTKPSMVASIVDALALGAPKSCSVLEIGTGTGYMTALLSKLARRVHTIDRFRTLSEAARKRFDQLGITNIVSQTADGKLGLPAAAPFDRIVSTCALEDVPKLWLDQLKPDGFLILPVGTNENQKVMRYQKKSDGEVVSEILAPSQFLHLAEGVAKEL